MFTIFLEIPFVPAQAIDVEQSSDCDSDSPVLQVLDFACDALSEVDGARFEMRLGHSLLPVDVRTDLPVFLAQVPSLLEYLRHGDGEFVLSMYEQGIETNVVFSARGEQISVRCEPLIAGDKARFDVSIEAVSRSLVLESIRQVRGAFLGACRDVCPRLIMLPSIVDWINATSGL